MLKNYFIISLRNLRRYKAYAFINILGLGLSMACGILIFVLVTFNLGFDHFHPAADRIYRVVTEQHRDNVTYTTGVPAPLGKVFREDYTYAELVARQAVYGSQLITVDDGHGQKRMFKEADGIAFTEPAFLELFNYPLRQGDKHTVLSEPGTTVITESLAKKYFGTTDVIGRNILVDNLLTFRITGVLQDFPVNTDLKIPILLSYLSLKKFDGWLGSEDSWGGVNGGMHCYIRLKLGVAPAEAEKAMAGYVKKYRAASKNIHHYRLQPLSDIHFNPHYAGVMEKKTLWIFSFIGIFLIVTACVNFINLATAQALRRSKEVGVRKVLGSARMAIFWQFLAETGVITVLAATAGVGIALLVLPSINDWFQVKMSIALFPGPLLPFLVALIVVVSFLAGSYPGLILAGFRPVEAIKGKITQQEIGGVNIRRGLIVAQFAIAQVLIIGMIVIAGQLRYVHDSDPGFVKDDIVLLPLPDNKKVPAIKALQARLLTVPGVQNVTTCFTAPAATDGWTTLFTFDNRTETEGFGINVRLGDDRYLSTFDLKLLAGRNFFPSDTVREMLVNETFVKKLNTPTIGSVIGKKLALNSGGMPGTIVGVVKDFHEGSFHDDINAVCITTLNTNYQLYAVKTNRASLRTVLPMLQKAWKETYPNDLYEQHFVDEDVAQFYIGEDRMLQLIQVFTIVAIFIGCLGLYGLVAFMVSQKTKEIGIRKVLGGRVRDILWIFGGEFSRLIFMALLIAVPVGWWLGSQWLMGFKFHIRIGAEVFGFTVLISIGVALLAGGYQAIKAALMNPIRALRSE